MRISYYISGLAFHENKYFLTILTPGPNVTKLSLSVFTNFRNKCLSLTSFFQPSLMFAGKTEAYPSEVPFRASGLIHKH